jgi:hypothetical protein
MNAPRARVLPDWPALLARLHARNVDVRRVLQVSRVTLWYWRTGMRQPNGTHALSLVALDRSANHC